MLQAPDLLEAPDLDRVDPSAVPATTSTTSTVVTPPRRHTHEYVHLAALFDERARLPADHPRRRLLRDQLITGHLPIARHIARKHLSRGGSLDDLEQVAYLGLILSVDRFEPGRGIDFLSFAVPTITGEVLRYFRDRHHMIRVPRRLRDVQAALVRASAELSQALGRSPRPSEIATHLGIDLATVLDGLEALYAGQPSSLDEPAGADGPSNNSAGPGSHGRFAAALTMADTATELVEYRATLGPLLATLTDRERRILLLRFFHGLTQTEIAGQIGVSQMQVSRLLAATLARLRRQATSTD
jgi:RNA polymerase sigma-B factor